MTAYKLEMTLDGGNINLEIKDKAKWALGPNSNFRAVANTPIGFNVHTDPTQSTLSLTSDDFKTPSLVYLTVYVETPLDTLTLAVSLLVPTDRLVLVNSGVDSFADKVPGNYVHVLKLK